MDSYPRALILAVAMTACLYGCPPPPPDDGNDNTTGDTISIIGNWVSQPPYNAFSAPGVLTVSNQEMLWEWDDESLGHVRAEIVQFDNENRTAIVRVTEHSTAPEQIGLFIKIVWTFLDADSMDMDVYSLQATEADALSDTIVEFGTWHYVSDAL